MINYQVDDLDVLLGQLVEAGVELVGEVEEYEYGRFAWILDPDGNKVELWEPN
jgi:predicted enzyme related to lactoylglutathione lyase